MAEDGWILGSGPGMTTRVDAFGHEYGRRGMSQQGTLRKERLIIALSIAGGVLLAVIGARYLLVPESAARTFGVPARPAGYELYYIIGLRNLWLGLLAVAFATLRQWRALMLWFAMATVVCFADAAIAATSTGRVPQVAFHVGCGVACALLAVITWRKACREN
ncbi:MAG: DUF4267 domain-containing protein [Hyphomicrobiaceae bacterium]|nr:MAG: DUF4267 domain-containing protein [Hyphomicrobiaceae bacterium]